jgi:hypothetical protein
VINNKNLFEIIFYGINTLFKNSKEILFENDHSFVDNVSTCEIELSKNKGNKHYIEESSTIRLNIDSLNDIPNYINRPVVIDAKEIIEYMLIRSEKENFNVNYSLYEEYHKDNTHNSSYVSQSVKIPFIDFITSKWIIFIVVVFSLFCIVSVYYNPENINIIFTTIDFERTLYFLSTPEFKSTINAKFYYLNFLDNTNYPMSIIIDFELLRNIKSSDLITLLGKAGEIVFNHLQNNGMIPPLNNEELNIVGVWLFNELIDKIPNGDSFIQDGDEFVKVFVSLVNS